jgi:urease accessory protein
MNNMNFNFCQDCFILQILHLPIGGYTHSNGLETYVQERIVHNVEPQRNLYRICFSTT